MQEIIDLRSCSGHCRIAFKSWEKRDLLCLRLVGSLRPGTRKVACTPFRTALSPRITRLLPCLAARCLCTTNPFYGHARGVSPLLAQRISSTTRKVAYKQVFTALKLDESKAPDSFVSRLVRSCVECETEAFHSSLLLSPPRRGWKPRRETASVAYSTLSCQ